MTVCKSCWMASKSSPRKTCTDFHPGLRTAKNPKLIAGEIGYTENKGRPGAAKHGIRGKDRNPGARLVLTRAGGSHGGAGISARLVLHVLKKLGNEVGGTNEVVLGSRGLRGPQFVSLRIVRCTTLICLRI